MPKIPRLTNAEVQTLQVDAAQRVILKNTQILTDLSREISEALCVVGNAKIKLLQLQNDKSTIIELNRALKTVIDNG